LIANLGVTNVNITGYDFVGGLVGYNRGGSTVSNCYSTGNVLGGHWYTGGLAGANESTVTKSYSTATVSGSIQVGGLVGNLSGPSPVISYCYSTGNVSGSGFHTGGLVGISHGGSCTISNSYSRGNVTNSGGTEYVGAFCGSNNDSDLIEYCYSTGSVFYGTGSATDNGFVGYNNSSGTYTNNFWDSELSNQSTATGATAKTTAEMKTLSTFTAAGWDFTTPIWRIDGTNNDGYPYLNWEPYASVTTQAVTGIGTTTATGNGNITSLGSPNPTQHGVCWNTTGTPTIAGSKTEEGAAAATGAFTSNITGLTPNTTYYVRAYATNTAGTSYGNEVTFPTNALAPTVTTQAVTGIGTTTATGNGTITDLGAPNPTQHGVCWSTSTNPTTALPTKTEQGAKNTTGAFTSNMTGLTTGISYYVRAYATNTAGTSYGSQVSFTTHGTAPTLATTTPTSYDCSVKKVEMWNGSTWIGIFSGTAQLDMVSGGTFPGISNLSLPAGTYTQVRVTFNNSFPVAGTLSYGGTAYYTTAATFWGQTNLASTPTTAAGSMAEFTFKVEAWGALNADVTQAFDITPVTVGTSTDYQPTLRFTISNRLVLKGTAGTPATYYFALSAPTVSIVEP